MMNFLKVALFIALSVLLQNLAQAQDWISYQSQQQINDLVDKDNELFMATDAGLVVMNKTSFEKRFFNKANSALPTQHIQSITQASNGVPYIGTYDAIIARFDGLEFQEITVPQNPAYNPQSTQLYDFKIAPNGDFWLGTTDGVFHRQGEDWYHYDQAELGASFTDAWDIEINTEGEVFIASHHIHKFADGAWSNISDTTQLFSYIDADLFASTSGDLFFAGDLARIGRFDGTNWQEYEVQLNGSEIVGFTEDLDGSIYFNTKNDGIFKLTNDTWIQQTDAQVQQFDNKTAYFYIDAQGNRWLNTDIVLSLNQNGNLQSNIISQHTIKNNSISKIHKAHNGHLYFIMTSGNYLPILDTDGNWSSLQVPSAGMTFEIIHDVLSLADNDIWVASNHGLHHYDGTNWSFNALEACRSFATDAQAKIYVQASDRVYIIDNGIITEYNTSNSPISSLIISGLGVDGENNLWIASFDWDGEAMIQRVANDGTWTNYTQAEYPVIDRPIGDFHLDSDGNIWIPSDLVGAMKFDGTSWTNPYAGNINEMDNYEVHAISNDASGKLYFSHQYGVTTRFNGLWEDLLIEEVPNIASSSSSNIIFDEDGTLWWASNRYGLFAYREETSSNHSPEIETMVDFSVFPNPASTYTTIDFSIQEKTSVQIRLYNNLGQLQSSMNLGLLPKGVVQERIEFSDLPKGIYVLQVQLNDKSYAKTLVLQ